MKLMVISLLLLLIPLASALEFSLSSPSQAEVNENVSAEIKSSSPPSSNYDVKIYVENSEKKIISEIYNDGWKSAFYYIKEAYPNHSFYTVRIKSEGNWQLCARLRSSNQSSFTQKCLPISISNNSNVNSSPQPANYSSESKNKSSSSSSANSSLISQSTSLQNQSDAQPAQAISGSLVKEDNQNDKITLSSPKKPASQNSSFSIFTSKEEKIRLAVLYAFSFFALIIIFFLASRKM